MNFQTNVNEYAFTLLPQISPHWNSAVSDVLRYRAGLPPIKYFSWNIAFQNNKLEYHARVIAEIRYATYFGLSKWRCNPTALNEVSWRVYIGILESRVHVTDRCNEKSTVKGEVRCGVLWLVAVGFHKSFGILQHREFSNRISKQEEEDNTTTRSLNRILSRCSHIEKIYFDRIRSITDFYAVAHCDATVNELVVSEKMWYFTPENAWVYLFLSSHKLL